MTITDKYFSDIKQIFPDTITITEPPVLGLAHTVYIVERAKGKYICRFSNKIVAEHNLKVSNILKTYRIKAPRVSIHDCGKYYCETYPFISGKTLYERLQEGLSGEKLDNVYRQIFDISYKIEKIPCKDVEKTPIPFSSDFLRRTVSFLNPSKKKLCHTDLHAKNIILDENDNVRAILDLDAVCCDYVSAAHFIIMKNAKKYGYDINKLFKLSKDIDINNPGMKMFSKISETYTRVFPESLRNQILKVRVK